MHISYSVDSYWLFKNTIIWQENHDKYLEYEYALQL